MYKATIIIDDTDLAEVLKAEKGLNNQRSSSIIKSNKIMIESQDIIAFKATMNGMIKVIEAYEKASSALK